MSESQSHKRAKAKAAGEKGKTEVILKGGKRLDAQTIKKAIEIERSGTSEGLKKAAKRLKISGKPEKVLTVPQKDMDKAAEAMKETGVEGTVSNIKGTKKKRIR